MSRKPLLALLSAVCALAVVPASAPAAIKVSVGIGDQNASMFDTPSFKKLRAKKVRYFIKWDAIDRPAEVDAAEAYVRRARAAKAQVFMHLSSNNLTRKQAKLPSVKTYRTKVRALIRRFKPLGVKTWGAMNEANHDSQPTWKNPKRAAQFFLALRKLCKGCTIVALDVLDQRGVERYIKRFYRALGKRRSLAKIVGIHNYSDTNRPGRKGRGTRSIIKTTKRYNRRTQFWLTETGGVVKFGASFPCNPANPVPAERKAARSLTNMFSLTRKFRRNVKRLYIYNFTGDDCIGRFDAGLVRRDGTPRAGYKVVRKQMKKFIR